MDNKYTRIAIIVISIILFIFFTVSLFPIRYRLLGYHLDESHKFASNLFITKHIIFGRDVLFSYGPLGFLMTPMDIGGNLQITNLLCVFLWVLFFSVLIYYTLKRHFSVLQAGLFVSFFYLSRLLSPSLDYFIAFLALLFLALSFSAKRWHFFYVTSLSLSLLSLFIKFSSAFLCISAVLSYILVVTYVDKKKAVRTIALTASFLLLFFCVLIFLFNASLGDMYLYLRGIYEIASGYTVATSLPGRMIELVAALSIFACYFVLACFLYRFRQSSFYISLFLIAPLFIAFKHGFVRQDKHVLWFFGFASLAFAVIFLFTKIEKIFKSAKSAKIIKWMIISGILFTMTASLYCDSRYRKKKVRERDLRAIFQEDLLNRIGTGTFSTFPFDFYFEIHRVSDRELNYKPFPVFHMYEAFTTYLDLLNSGYLEDRDRAPEFILMDWAAIEGHHPLAGAPATWLSMYRWYKVDRQGYPLLLKRRGEPSFDRLEFVERKMCRVGDFIEVPVSDNPVVVKIDMRLNIIGKIVKIFYKIPEVNMKVFMGLKSEAIFRIVPDTIDDGLLINFLPFSLDDVSKLLGNKATYKIKGFKICGRGCGFYDKKIIIDFYKIPDIQVR